MKTYHDTMSDQDKLDLADFLASLDAERDFLRENPYTPVFGQYVPDLVLSDPYDDEAKPDDHYYQAQGVEPPQESQDGFKAAMCRLVRNKEFCAFLGAMALFLVALAVFGN